MSCHAMLCAFDIALHSPVALRVLWYHTLGVQTVQTRQAQIMFATTLEPYCREARRRQESQGDPSCHDMALGCGETSPGRLDRTVVETFVCLQNGNMDVEWLSSVFLPSYM
jgi:hypothetical protein